MSDLRTNSRVVLAGGSGFLGLSLAKYLTDRGVAVSILSRTAPAVSGPWQHVVWDGRSLGAWRDHLEGASGLVNLAGRSVDCIKSPDHQDEILRSRVESTRVLGAALRTVSNPPPVWVQMSTAHIYGDPPSAICDEESELGYGLAPAVGRAWEQSYRESVLPSQRQVILRASFVLGHGSVAGMGALRRLVPLVRLGLGGRIGSGRQGMSWIHERDMNRLFERGLTDTAMQGVYVASAPNPVSQAELMREMRRAIGVPIGLPAFEWMVRIGAPLLLRTDPELALYGRYVISKRLQDEGFAFSLPTIREAMQELFVRKRPHA